MRGSAEPPCVDLTRATAVPAGNTDRSTFFKNVGPSGTFTLARVLASVAPRDDGVLARPEVAKRILAVGVRDGLSLEWLELYDGASQGGVLAGLAIEQLGATRDRAVRPQHEGDTARRRLFDSDTLRRKVVERISGWNRARVDGDVIDAGRQPFRDERAIIFRYVRWSGDQRWRRG